MKLFVERDSRKLDALVVLSGGQDSTTALFWAAEHFKTVHAVTFNYGQRHAREIDAATRVAEMAGVRTHEVVDIGPILKGRSFLTDHDAPVETFSSFEHMAHHNAFKENKLDSSFVPQRNTLFLTLAANRAAVLGCKAIVTGVTAADFAEYGDFSWEWLGGFVDAEGCFSNNNARGSVYPMLEVSQKDPEFMARLLRWVQAQSSVKQGSVRVDKAGCAYLSLGANMLRELMPLLSPHMHTPHRRRQAERVGLTLAPEVELSMSYVAGFWEGDGSCSSRFTFQQSRKGGKLKTPTPSFQFSFFQKSPVVLDKIAEFLGRRARAAPYNVNTPNPVYALTLSDGPYAAELLSEMRQHFNILGSFKKVTKNRHKIGFEAGGFNPPYPDCTPDFIWRMNQALAEAVREPDATPAQIVTPLMFKTKAQSVHMAQRLPGCMEALAYSHTAYSGEYPPLTQDHATVLRAQGFFEAGVPDPLILRAWREGLMPLPETSNYNAARAGATATA